jgi:hypothetical protein
MFIGIDYLMLGAVVGKDSPDIGYQIHCPEVNQEKANTDDALYYVAQ